MTPLALDPSWVRPGYTPLIILIVLALVCTLLFFSMRKQFRRIDVPRSESDDRDPPA